MKIRQVCVLLCNACLGRQLSRCVLCCAISDEYAKNRARCIWPTSGTAIRNFTRTNSLFADTMDHNASEERVRSEDATPTKSSSKSHKSSVCLIPPEDCWTQIQEIRSVHDKAYKRWMPHVNLLYPFLPDYADNFPQAADKLKDALGHMAPFKVTLDKDSFGFFSHSKNTTLWLRPRVLTVGDDQTADSGDASGGGPSGASNACHQRDLVVELQSKLEGAFPEFNDQSTKSDDGFQPHLSLGQFKRKEVEQMKARFQKDWQDISFVVKEVYLISRADFDDPFHVRQTVPLGTLLP